jgi:hypothetical protein
VGEDAEYQLPALLREKMAAAVRPDGTKVYDRRYWNIVVGIFMCLRCNA